MDKNAPTFENRKPSRHQKYMEIKINIYLKIVIYCWKQAGTKLLLTVTTLWLISSFKDQLYLTVQIRDYFQLVALHCRVAD